ncbi:MAG TPA: dihydrofolate reductase family protein [Arthrobacter sp.]|nr:dihydrofolate reductase family protein [Arthrobacter sp.]
MAKLIYSMLTSLDGYVVDSEGNFDWAAPDDEVHQYVNDLEGSIGTYLYGRRVYEVMLFWESADRNDAGMSAPERQFTDIWHGVDKIVFSRTLDSVSTARTTLERDFDAEAIRQLKATAERNLAIAGPTLASQAIKAGLVDELHLYTAPVVVGGGTRFLPDDVHVDLELLDSRQFGNGMVHAGYRVRTGN